MPVVRDKRKLDLVAQTQFILGASRKTVKLFLFSTILLLEKLNLGMLRNWFQSGSSFEVADNTRLRCYDAALSSDPSAEVRNACIPALVTVRGLRFQALPARIRRDSGPGGD